MNDTPVDFKQRCRLAMMALLPEARLVMGAQMHESARRLVLASLPPGLSESERRYQLFLRFYGRDDRNANSGLEAAVFRGHRGQP